jgi:hypothetical protein
VIIVPLMLAFGLTGYALGMAAVAVIQMLMRGYFYPQRPIPPVPVVTCGGGPPSRPWRIPPATCLSPSRL